jgi:hypothetical protein
MYQLPRSMIDSGGAEVNSGSVNLSTRPLERRLRSDCGLVVCFGLRVSGLVGQLISSLTYSVGHQAMHTGVQRFGKQALNPILVLSRLLRFARNDSVFLARQHCCCPTPCLCEERSDEAISSTKTGTSTLPYSLLTCGGRPASESGTADYTCKYNRSCAIFRRNPLSLRHMPEL